MLQESGDESRSGIGIETLNDKVTGSLSSTNLLLYLLLAGRNSEKFILS